MQGEQRTSGCSANTPPDHAREKKALCPFYNPRAGNKLCSTRSQGGKRDRCARALRPRATKQLEHKQKQAGKKGDETIPANTNEHQSALPKKKTRKWCAVYVFTGMSQVNCASVKEEHKKSTSIGRANKPYTVRASKCTQELGAGGAVPNDNTFSTVAPPLNDLKRAALVCASSPGHRGTGGFYNKIVLISSVHGAGRRTRMKIQDGTRVCTRECVCNETRPRRKA